MNLGTQVFTFDGISDTHIDLSSAFQCVKGNNPRSIAFTVKTTCTSSRVAIIFTGQAVTLQGFQIEYNWGFGPNNILGVDAFNYAYFPTTGTIINDGVWHTVLVTYDGTTLRIYVDGILTNSATDWNLGARLGSIASSLYTQGNTIYIGHSGWDGNLWSGSLKNVQFYDYVIPISNYVAVTE